MLMTRESQVEAMAAARRLHARAEQFARWIMAQDETVTHDDALVRAYESIRESDATLPTED